MTQQVIIAESTSKHSKLTAGKLSVSWSEAKSPQACKINNRSCSHLLIASKHVFTTFSRVHLSPSQTPNSDSPTQTRDCGSYLFRENWSAGQCLSVRI